MQRQTIHNTASRLLGCRNTYSSHSSYVLCITTASQLSIANCTLPVHTTTPSWPLLCTARLLINMYWKSLCADKHVCNNKCSMHRVVHAAGAYTRHFICCTIHRSGNGNGWDSSCKVQAAAAVVRVNATAAQDSSAQIPDHAAAHIGLLG